jgi:hypothetical protein
MAENIKGSIMSAANRDVKFIRPTKVPCPTCGGEHRPDNVLYVRSDIDGTAELECKNCGYSEFKESTSGKTDLSGNPIKADWE